MVDETFIDIAVPESTASPSPPPAALSGNTDTSGKQVSVDLTAMQQELGELKNTFSQYIRQHTPDIDQVRQALQDAENERDNATGELKKLQRKNTLDALANQTGFNDVEFLDYLLQKNNIAIEDSNALKDFMQKLRDSHPRYFVLPIKSGSGSRPRNTDIGDMLGNGFSRREAVEFLLASAPEVF